MTKKVEAKMVILRKDLPIPVSKLEPRKQTMTAALLLKVFTWQ